VSEKKRCGIFPDEFVISFTHEYSFHEFLFYFFPSSPLPVLSTQLRTRYEGMDVEGGGKRYQGKEEEKKNKYLREREREEGDDYVPPVSRPVYTSYKKITTTT